MALYNKYNLKLYPVSDDAYNMYTYYLGGTEKEYPNNDNAGFDLLTSESTTYTENEKIIMLKLGVKAVMINTFTQQSVHFWLSPRSSIWKNGVVLANSMGVIDRSYRGELMAACMKYTNTSENHINFGTRLVQIIAPEAQCYHYFQYQ